VVEFELNGEKQALDVALDTPLLWVLRDNLKLTGTKFGCGVGLCGACTVHLDGQAVRSCSMPISAIEGRSVATIESLGGEHPLQHAWVEHNVPQCGYCQSGQIMSAAALLASNNMPSDEEIRNAMSGNICRCGTYNKIRKAIQTAASAGVQTFDPSKESGHGVGSTAQEIV
jgi:isoquinoline 1-oxidoreductase alpha subunit